MFLGNYWFYFILFDSFHLSLTQCVLSFVLSFQKLIENFQLQSQSIKPPLPLAELQSRMDMLQVSQQTVEGATWQQYHVSRSISCVITTVFYVTSVNVLFKKETVLDGLLSLTIFRVAIAQPVKAVPPSASVHTLQASDFCSLPLSWIPLFAGERSRKPCQSEVARDHTTSHLRSVEPSCKQTW